MSMRKLGKIRRGVVMARQGIPPYGEPKLTCRAYERTTAGLVKRAVRKTIHHMIEQAEEAAILSRLEDEL